MSLFCAVMMWQTPNNAILRRKRYLERVGESNVAAHANVFGLAFFFTLILLGIFCLVIRNGVRYKKTVRHHLGAFLSVWAHVVGFSLLNVVAHLQDLFVAFAEDQLLMGWIAGAVWLVCAAIFPSSLRLLYLTLYHTYAEQYFDDIQDVRRQHEELEELREKFREFIGESCALAFSWTFMRLMIAFFLGEMPDVFQVTHRSKTSHERLILCMLALIFTTAAGVTSLVNELVTWFFTAAKKHEKHAVKFLKVFVKNFFNMLAAWTWLQFFRWCAYEEAGAHGHANLTLHICLAFGITLVSLAIVPIVTALANKMCKRLLADIILISAVLSAFSWELAIDILFEVVAADASSLPVPWDSILSWKAPVSHTPLFSAVVVILLLAVLLPLYMVGIYPLTNEKSFKHALQDGDLELEDDELEFEESEE